MALARGHAWRAFDRTAEAPRLNWLDATYGASATHEPIYDGATHPRTQASKKLVEPTIRSEPIRCASA
jgi:hypothetical protein